MPSAFLFQGDMRTISIILENSRCGAGAPLQCGCSGVYMHLKPRADLPVRTTSVAPGANLLYGVINPPTNLGDIDADCKEEWQYSIDIDETQLINENEPITNCDIESICCSNCELQAAVKMIAAIPYEYTLTVDGLDVTLTNDDTGDTSGGTVTIATDDSIDGDGSAVSPLSVNISADAGNITGLGTDGGLLSVINTDDSIDGDGTLGDPLTVALSTDADNGIIKGTDGAIYFPATYAEVASDGVTGNAGPLDISAVATYNIDTLGPIVLNNPSPVRDEAVLLVGSYNVQCDLLATGVWKIIVEQSLDGAGFTSFAEAQFGPFANNVSIPLTIQASHEDTVPAGGSLTIERRITIETVTGTGASSLAGQYSGDMRLIRVTK